MSIYGKKVIAVLDTNSTFGVKFQKVIDDVSLVQSQMSSLLLDAPEQLDTLKELADALGNDPGFFTTVADQVSELNTDVTDVVTALGVSENDNTMGTFSSPELTDGASLKSVLETFAGSFSNTKTTLTDALTSAGLRLDALEADPTTKTYVDTQISDLIGGAPDLLNTLDEIAAAISDDENVYMTLTNADTALSNRLDVLEVDPTTAAAVAAVQADVDQNESDADAAIALKLNIANPAATGDLTVDTQTRLEFDSNITKLHNDLRGTRLDIGNNITVYPAAAGGRFEIEGGLYIRLSDLVEANNDNDAETAGVIVGGVYYDGNGHLKIRVS